MVSGLAEAAICGFAFLAGFVDYTAHAVFQAFAWLEYVFHPHALLLGYFFAEGIIRFVVALVSGESLGTLPLCLLAWTQARITTQAEKRKLGPRVADIVERGDGENFDLRIASWQEKEDWENPITISYRDDLYEILAREKSAPPRPFVYLLKRKPASEIIRLLYYYYPEENSDD